MYFTWSLKINYAVLYMCSTRTAFRNVYNGLPLTLMKLSYMMAYCPLTTGWLVIADTDFGFTLCPDYMPAGDTASKPYFKHSSLTTIADLSTRMIVALCQREIILVKRNYTRAELWNFIRNLTRSKSEPGYIFGLHAKVHEDKKDHKHWWKRFKYQCIVSFYHFVQRFTS